MVSSWKLPVVWVCENNGLSMFVPFEETHPTENIADLAPGYGMPGTVVDGQDVVAVAEAVMSAVERARKGKGPSLIECKTQRFVTHSPGLPDMVGSELRAKEDIDELRKRDPINLHREMLIKENILTKEDIKRVDRDVATEIEEACRFADESPIPGPECLESALYAN